FDGDRTAAIMAAGARRVLFEQRIGDVDRIGALDTDGSAGSVCEGKVVHIAVLPERTAKDRHIVHAVQRYRTAAMTASGVAGTGRGAVPLEQAIHDAYRVDLFSWERTAEMGECGLRVVAERHVRECHLVGLAQLNGASGVVPVPAIVVVAID